jgi:hypothetical protein
VTGLDRYAGAYLYRGAHGKRGGFQCKQVIAKVFARVGDDWNAGGAVEKLYAEHGLMVTERG